MANHKFQVAISFAGEQRAYASRLARELQGRGVTIFYDEFYTPELWGKNLAEEFHRIYSKDANYTVMLISKEYVEKNWTRHERRAAIERALEERSEYILPICFDKSWPEGISTTTAYLSADDKSAEEVAVILCKKLGVDIPKTKASNVAAPQISSVVADVSFDFTSFNGRYVIGDGELSFETRWSKAGGNSIHAYNDGASIHGIAIAVGAKSLADIKDASKYDFTSRSRTPVVGEFLVLRNTNGFYAVIKILEVRAKGHGGVDDYLKFFFMILKDGGADFSEYSVLE